MEGSYLLGTTLYSCVATGIVKWLDVLPLSPPNHPLSETSYESLIVDEFGFRQSQHWGPTRDIMVQDELFEKGYGLPKGVSIANTRAWSAVSQEDLDIIQRKMDCPSKIPFSLLRPNIGISGVDFFSKYMPGTLLVFKKKGAARVILSVFSGNNPCHIPAMHIVKTLDFPAAEKMFSEVAKEHRGLVGPVIRGGKVSLGQSVDILVPTVMADWYISERLKWNE